MSREVVSKRSQVVKPRISQNKRTNGRIINQFGPSQMISLAEIEPPLNNVRKEFNKDKLMELAASIKKRGVLQAILVRPIAPSKQSKAKYQIVAGERRFRASKLAGLKEIPARVMKMDDGEAHDTQLVENLHREDLHPLDEADGLRRSMEEENLDVPTLAQRLAKQERYVARRLALTNLIEEAREDLRQNRITLAHALEICRLAPEVQSDALKACYESKYIYNEKTRTHSYAPDKTKPARHVSHLQAWLESEIYLNLHNYVEFDQCSRGRGKLCRVRTLQP